MQMRGSLINQILNPLGASTVAHARINWSGANDPR